MKPGKAIIAGLGLVVTALAAAPGFAQASPYPWSPQEPQGSYSQTWHNGFRAGEDAANRDLTAKFSPALSRHADYRQPDLAPIAAEQFREGFRFAYQAVVDYRLHHVANANSAVNNGPSD